MVWDPLKKWISLQSRSFVVLRQFSKQNQKWEVGITGNLIDASVKLWGLNIPIFPQRWLDWSLELVLLIFPIFETVGEVPAYHVCRHFNYFCTNLITEHIFFVSLFSQLNVGSQLNEILWENLSWICFPRTGLYSISPHLIRCQQDLI